MNESVRVRKTGQIYEQKWRRTGSLVRAANPKTSVWESIKPEWGREQMHTGSQAVSPRYRIQRLESDRLLGWGGCYICRVDEDSGNRCVGVGGVSGDLFREASGWQMWEVKGESTAWGQRAGADTENQGSAYSSIQFHDHLSFCTVMGGLETIPADIGWEQGTPWTGGRFITGLTYRDKQPFTFTPTSKSESVNLQVFGLWEEAGVPGERTHAENMQTAHRKNPGPSCCETMVLSTQPPCCPLTLAAYLNIKIRIQLKNKLTLC